MNIVLNSIKKHMLEILTSIPFFTLFLNPIKINSSLSVLGYYNHSNFENSLLIPLDNVRVPRSVFAEIEHYVKKEIKAVDYVILCKDLVGDSHFVISFHGQYCKIMSITKVFKQTKEYDHILSSI